MEIVLYLARRHLTWWAYHDLPAHLHKSHGKRLARSLQTHHKQTALRLAAGLWAHEWSGIAAGKAGVKEEEAEALFYKDLVKRAATERERALLLDHVAELAETRHNAAKTATERQAALRFNDTVRGKITPTLHHVEEWLAGLRDKPATVQAKRRVVEQFAEAFPILQEVETRAVQTWLTERTRKEDLAAPTVDRLIGFPRAYWRYLMDTGVIEANPLGGLRRPTGVRKVESWVPFSPEEVVALRDAASAKGDAELSALIELGMWTGARIDELGSLKVTDVNFKTRAFKITAAKSKAGVREIPIHPNLMSTLKTLVGKRMDGYVLDRPRAGSATRRSKAVGERFGDLKSKLGHDERRVFHSIRKTVGTMLENAGVLENIAADILGHDTQRITYKIYSGGASLEVKRVALGKLKY